MIRQGLGRWHSRYPWLLPLLSFAAGWAGFWLTTRGEGMARIVAALVLLGWPWLLAENLLGGWLTRASKGRLPAGLLRLITQSLQQEILFFSLPFLLASLQLDDSGQLAFVGLTLAAALASTLDPLYHGRIAAQPGLAIAFHAYCTFIASLVVLPIAAHLPLERALPLAIAITVGALLLGLPRMLHESKTAGGRALGLIALIGALSMIWPLRSLIPPAGLSVRDSRITQRIDGLEPGAEVSDLRASELQDGVVAFVAVRAPQGLAQGVVFEWHHQGRLTDRIPADIQGGSQNGWRIWSRKQQLGADPRGAWRVDLRTPHGLLIARLRFAVN